jgi:hypothetical protein
MCKYEVLLLVIAELSRYYNLKESELSRDCLKRGCLRGIFKMPCSTRNWQFTLFNLCDHEILKSKSNENRGITQCSLLRSTQNKNCMILASNVHEI